MTMPSSPAGRYTTVADALRPPPQQAGPGSTATAPVVLLTDLDNTLFNWIDYFAPCFREMVAALSRASGIHEAEISRQFGDVYRERQAAEYRRAIQELALHHRVSPAVRARLVREGWTAFVRERRRRLRTYPGVPETLRTLRGRGVTVVGVTNAALTDAASRLRQLRLTGLFDGLVAWEGVPDPGEQALAGPHRTRLPTVVPLKTPDLKPSRAAFFTALECGRALPDSQIVAVGDSLANDLAPARHAGATTVWARYGHECDRENYELISQITFWPPERISSTYDRRSHTPDYEIDSFRQLLQLAPLAARR